MPFTGLSRLSYLRQLLCDQGFRESQLQTRAAAESESSSDEGSDTLENRCPAGHVLQEFETKHSLYVCDGCEDSLLVGETLAHCTICNFDLCTECAPLWRDLLLKPCDLEDDNIAELL
jgi:hypothetical protein